MGYHLFKGSTCAGPISAGDSPARALLGLLNFPPGANEVFMILRRSVYSFTLLLLLLIYPFARAQTSAPSPPADGQKKAQLELERKALDLLDEVIKQSESFRNAENRIRIRAVAADLLWKYDDRRARTLFREATASLSDLLNNQENTEQPSSPRSMSEGLPGLRHFILQLAGQHDARLAGELLRATRRAAAAGNQGSRSPEDELNMEMTLATQFVATDPAQALQLAREDLSRGFPTRLPEVVSALWLKDQEMGAKLAAEIVVKLRSERLERNNAAAQMAVNLLRMASDPPVDEAKNSSRNIPLLDQQALRELAEMIAAEALRSPSAGNSFTYLVHSVLPAVEKYAPARAAQLRRKLAPVPTAIAQVDEENEMEGWGAYNGLYAKGSIEEILAAAPKAPEEMRDLLYQRAASLAIEKGETERSRQLINEHVKDPNLRKRLLEEVEQKAVLTAAEQGKIEQARKMLSTLRTNQERVSLLTQLALGALAKGEQKIALQLLEEAREMVTGRARNIEQLGVQVMLARAYALVDPDRSLTMLEPIVDQLNELLAAATVLGGFFVEELVRDDELMLEPLVMFSSQFMSHYLNDLKHLALADFERTKALADRFQRDEARIMARLLVVQSIIGPPQTAKPSDPLTVQPEPNIATESVGP
jgi:hypothetical protein